MSKVAHVSETLDLQIDLDASTRLPLLKEQSTIINLVETYLPLPYIVAEHGCGKKCSLIIQLMADLGIPPWALRRGMVMERDMSPETLDKPDFSERDHALRITNPLWQILDMDDAPQRHMLEEQGIRVDTTNRLLEAGDFTLHDTPILQFRFARSHIYPIITFWDQINQHPVDLVVDPTLIPTRLFEPVEIRRLVDAPESVLFSAALLGRFRLDLNLMTPSQQNELNKATHGDPMDRMSYRKQAAITRSLLGAEPDSIGDPLTWTYANNIIWGDKRHDEEQLELTGQGDPLASRFRDLLEARAAFSDEVSEHLHELESFAQDMELKNIIRTDAVWSEIRLEPLVRVANTVVYRNALSRIADVWNGRDALNARIDDPAFLDTMRGIEVRLRDRVEKASAVSRDPDGRIDARALNGRFNRTVVEAIRQMNRAGLSVFVDRVGNIHGLSVPPNDAEELARHPEQLRDRVQHAICHCSHLDTVHNAGKWDGRLGVLSGIEVANIMQDLEDYFDLDLRREKGAILMVSAFIGEEMTFTGEGVSMPGSAAITGNAATDEVYRMVNLSGSRFRSKLIDMLRSLAVQTDRGTIELVNDFDSDREQDLLASCFNPELFYTPYTYERHIEQGGVLDRNAVPLVLVDRVMGIHQEDITFTGARAEEAALELVARLRDLAGKSARVTVGILESEGEARRVRSPAFAYHWLIKGEMNHAGATPLVDRRDPGVAAGRLAREFHTQLSTWNEAHGTDLKPVIGSAGFSPGMNRNVIPASASLVLGAEGGPLSEADEDSFMRSMHAFVLGTLSCTVKNGGEGVRDWEASAVSFVNALSTCRISIDLRAPRTQQMDSVQDRIAKELDTLSEQFGVRVSRDVQQQLDPIPLRETGQVLQIERSYGGSHNPNEAELAVDLLRGTVVQLESTMAFVSVPVPDGFNLFENVHARIPRSWKARLNTFTSGALHDTCNVALRHRTAASVDETTPSTAVGK